MSYFKKSQFQTSPTKIIDDTTENIKIYFIGIIKYYQICLPIMKLIVINNEEKGNLIYSSSFLYIYR